MIQNATVCLCVLIIKQYTFSSVSISSLLSSLPKQARCPIHEPPLATGINQQLGGILPPLYCTYLPVYLLTAVAIVDNWGSNLNTHHAVPA